MAGSSFTFGINKFLQCVRIFYITVFLFFFLLRYFFKTFLSVLSSFEYLLNLC